MNLKSIKNGRGPDGLTQSLGFVKGKGMEGKESFKKIKVDFFVTIRESKIKKTEPVAVVFPSPQLT